MKWLQTNWFILTLIALAFCALPGALIVVLRLFGADGVINGWLLNNLNITYDLRVPPWIALIFVALPIALVILYFLRLKRKAVQVPSTFLWKKSVEDLHVNSLFQWLRNNVLLLLQLLVLLFLIYSVLGFRIHGSVGTSRHYILLIDNSASMSAKDVAPTRLDWAKAEALKEIDAASDTDFGMVIVFNSKASTLQTYTNDREKLREAVRGIQQTFRSTRIEEALALAESLANPVRSTEDTASQDEDVPEDQKRTMVQARGIDTTVHLYSDGRFSKLSEATLANFNARLAGKTSALGKLNLQYHMAGKIKMVDDKPVLSDANNLAIVGLNVRRQVAPGKAQPRLIALVRVANYRSDRAAVRLKLDVRDADGKLIVPLQQDIPIAKRTHVAETADADEKDEPGEASARFQLPAHDPGKTLVLHAYLDKAGDDFPLDDHAWLVVGTTRKAKVLIVGDANRVLDACFDQEATRRYAIFEHLSPKELTSEGYRKKARNGEYDWIIFDRCAPADEADMPMANTLFIDRPPPPWVRGDVTLKSPLAMPSRTQHPALRNLNTIWDVRIDEAFSFDVKKNLTPKAAAELDLPDDDPKKRILPTITRLIETSNRKPLLFTLPRGPHTDLVMAFALINDNGDVMTNWPLETSFPLFFRNILYMLGNVDDARGAMQITPGEPVVLRPEAGFSFVTITDPADRVVKLTRNARNEVLFNDTERLGVYRYQVSRDAQGKQADDLVRGLAVNLLDANESNLTPRVSFRIGNEQISRGAEKSQTREIWKWILLLALLLLGVEWFIYHRRIAV
ncbi:MAG: VWA domain-containing protein [Planctomycetes bacterium]|nr:VWA domain-containing protein [Planctomycetota bacterium]